MGILCNGIFACSASSAKQAGYQELLISENLQIWFFMHFTIEQYIFRPSYCPKLYDDYLNDSDPENMKQ